MRHFWFARCSCWNFALGPPAVRIPRESLIFHTEFRDRSREEIWCAIFVLRRMFVFKFWVAVTCYKNSKGVTDFLYRINRHVQRENLMLDFWFASCSYWNSAMRSPAVRTSRESLISHTEFGDSLEQKFDSQLFASVLFVFCVEGIRYDKFKGFIDFLPNSETDSERKLDARFFVRWLFVLRFCVGAIWCDFLHRVSELSSESKLEAEFFGSMAVCADFFRWRHLLRTFWNISVRDSCDFSKQQRLYQIFWKTYCSSWIFGLAFIICSVLFS